MATYTFLGNLCSHIEDFILQLEKQGPVHMKWEEWESLRTPFLFLSYKLYSPMTNRYALYSSCTMWCVRVHMCVQREGDGVYLLNLFMSWIWYFASDIT